MHSLLIRRTTRSRTAFVASALACTLALAACSSDSTGPAPRAASTTYDGLVFADSVGGDAGGALHIVFDEAQGRLVGTGSSSIAVCSVVCGTFYGEPILGGTVSGDSVTFYLVLGSYDVVAGGRIVGGRFNGTFRATSDADTVTGSFTAYSAQNPTDVQLYCGAWSSTQYEGENGAWVFFVAGSEVVGFADFDGVTGKLTGTFANDSVKIKASVSDGEITASLTANGGYVTPGDPSTLEGTFHVSFPGGTDGGTWFGSSCEQAAATRFTR